MKRILCFFNSIIDEYGVKAFSAVLFFAVTVLLILFAVLSAYTFKDGWFFLSARSIQNLIGYISAFLQLTFYLMLWIVPVIFLLTAGYFTARKILLADDDPLFAPKATLLLLPVLLRVFWEIPVTHAILQEILHDTSGISQLIAGIMIVGLAANLIQYISLEREHKTFLEAESQSIAVHPELGEWLTRIDKVMVSRSSILARKWRNLRDVVDYSQYADYETLMSFPNQHELLKESKVSFIIKILPLLGMIGTVLGFTLAVTGMRDAASGMQDFSSFKGNMLEALGGMKNAFLTTLSGMLGMVIVMWMNSLLEESRRRILLMEDEFLYINFFLPWQKYRREKDKSSS
ncbi:MAG: MotA/TolQ/ExbB proton channel family protein [Desulforhabdus sp.]|jgi:hypothetical protein|nr:MotA/TolQ/ExbB proton channel family protein [Desulforhabdus sp.]